MVSTVPLFVFLLFAMAGGALGRRLAGGLIVRHFPFPVGTQGGRAADGLLAGASLAPLVVWTGHPWWWAAAIAAATLAGDMLQALPRRAGGSVMVPSTASDVLLLSLLNGGLALAPAAAAGALVGVPPWWLLIAAALHGPAYWAATLWQPRWTWCDTLNRDGILEAPPLSDLHASLITALAGWTPALDGLGEVSEQGAEFRLYDTDESAKPAGEVLARFSMLAIAPLGAPFIA